MGSHVDDKTQGSTSHFDPRNAGQGERKSAIFVISSPEWRFTALETLQHSQNFLGVTFSLVLSLVMLGLQLLDSLGGMTSGFLPSGTISHFAASPSTVTDVRLSMTKVRHAVALSPVQCVTMLLSIGGQVDKDLAGFPTNV